MKCKKIKYAKKKKATEKHDKCAEAQDSGLEAKATKVSASFEARVSF